MLVACFMIFVLILVGCSSNTKEVDSSSEGEKSGEESKEKIVLKFATALPKTHPFSVAGEQPFMERVTELTDGQVEWDWYPAEQLGKTADALSLTKDGVTDLAYYSPNYTPSEMPIASALMGMPALFETADEGSFAYYNVSQKSPMLETDYLNNGVRPVFNMATPTYDILTNGKEVKVPGDLKGFTIRSSGGVISEALKFAGANPVQLTTPDIFGAFDKGMIDGVHLYPTVINAFGMKDLITYTTRGLNFTGGVVGFIINEEKFQSLPKNVQDAIIQAGKEVSISAGLADERVNNEFFEEWAKEGKIKIYELNEDEKSQWEKVYKEFNESWLKKQNDDFKKSYEQVIEEVESYRKSN